MTEAIIRMTTSVVTSHLSNNKMETDAVLKFMRDVHSVFRDLIGSEPTDAPGASIDHGGVEGGSGTTAARSDGDLVDAVRWPGVYPDKIVCLEDQKEVTLLKSYIRGRFELSPEEYRTKWKLPDDYPMAPPEYVERKRDMARVSGLGTILRPTPKEPEPSPESTNGAGHGRIGGRLSASFGGRH